MEAALNGPQGRIIIGPTNLTIGRVPDNQLVVNDVKASSHHAEMRLTGQNYSIVDLSSTNGTFVNEQRIPANTPYTLNPDDKIRIGDTTFTYEVSGSPQFAQTLYGVPDQGYQPTVAAESPYVNTPPGYLPTIAAPNPYSNYEQAPQQGIQLPGQGFAPPPPGYVPPAGVIANAQPVARRRSRRLLVIFGIIGGVLVLSCVAFVLLAYAVRSTPAKTLDTFCNGIKNKDYQTAYNQLSDRLRKKNTEVVFANFFNKFTSCSYSPINESDPNATTTTSYFSANAQPVNAPTELIQDKASNNDWKIDGINFPTTNQ